MLTIKGKYNTATVYTDNLTDSTVGQIMTLAIKNLRRMQKFELCLTLTAVPVV